LEAHINAATLDAITPLQRLILERAPLMLSEGWAGLCDPIGARLAKSPELSGHAALDELTGDFAAQTGRMNDAHRLNTGRSIGSGMVEGAAKNLIGKRLKPRGARWVFGNADAMATLCSLSDSDHWDLDWALPNGMPESAGAPSDSRGSRSGPISAILGSGRAPRTRDDCPWMPST